MGGGSYQPDETADLAAPPDAPWIGVHVLSEFMFCPRAGIIAFEESPDDTGQELDRAPRLDYLPDFEVALIEQGLRDAWDRISTVALWSFAGGLLIVGGSFFVWLGLAFLLLPGGWYASQSLLRDFAAVWELHRRLATAERAVAAEPDPSSEELQAVNWWNLLKAGFTPVEYEEAHADPELRVAGRPWRVLHKGSLRIPVFRKRRGEAELYPQHFARMAAYCHVLAAAEGGESPYGIVLFGDGYDGATVPDTSQHRETFFHALRKARRHLKALAVRKWTPEPPPATYCRGCPCGKPRRYVPGYSEAVLSGVRISASPRRGNNGKLYHSTCGDRFDWAPPHEWAEDKGIG